MNEFLAGCVAGCTSKVVEFPFDTVKVVQQANSISSIRECSKLIYKNNGFTGFYKGLSLPLFAATVESAVAFSAFKTAKRSLDSVLPNYLATLSAGGAAGAVTSLFVTPIEFVKCNLQVQQTTAKFKSPMHCVIQSCREGGLGGIYKGFAATLFRDVPGSALWFGTYDGCLRVFGAQDRNANNSMTPFIYMIAGASSGVAYWTAFFPADVVKSRVQTQNETSSLPTKFWSMMRHIYYTEGIKGLYRGYTITAVRAAPSNALIFYLFEFFSKKIKT